MLRTLRPTALLLVFGAVAATAAAEQHTFAVLANGRVMAVTSVTRHEGNVRLVLRSGGELEVPESFLERIDVEGSPEPLAAVPTATPGAPTRPIPDHPWREEMMRAADRYALDPILVHAVAQAESGLDPAAVSPKGAMGLMQLMPATARDLGVTDPFDPIQSIDGGCRYLRAMLDRFDGDLRLALAAYNAGPNTVSATGRVPDFPETRSYVERVLRQVGRL